MLYKAVLAHMQTFISASAPKSVVIIKILRGRAPIWADVPNSDVICAAKGA